MKTPFNEQAWLNWLVRARVLVITLLLAMELALDRARSAPGKGRFLIVIIAWYLVGVFYLLLLRGWKNQRMQARLQILTDLMLATALIYVTGGIETLFNFIYPLIILMAAIMLPLAWAFLTAGFAFVLYGAVLELSYFGLVRSYGMSRPDASALQAAILVNLIAYMAIAYLSTRLVSKLQIVKGELELTSGALESLQVLNERIIDSMTSGLISTDMEGRIAVVNPAGARLLGCTQSKLIGLPLKSLFGEMLPSATGLRSEMRYRRLEAGEAAEQVFGVGVCSLRSGDGAVQGQLYTFTDLTQIRRLERELQMRDRMAAVGRLASGIAHEIRNPLTAIAGSAQMLGEFSGLGEDELQLLRIVRRESERLNQIVTDFLSYTRDQQCRKTVQKIVPLLEDTLRLLENRPECQSGQVKIERDIPKADWLVCLDGNRVKQVFWNISDNALRAMSEGGTLKVRIWVDGDGVHVSFADTGIGIDRKQMEGIFEPFHAGFANSKGLGLAIVYQIMQAHEGSVAVQSEAGKGSIFTLNFKCATPAEVAAAAGGCDVG